MGRPLKTAKAERENRELFQDVLDGKISNQRVRTALFYLLPYLEKNQTFEAVQNAARKRDSVGLEVLTTYFEAKGPQWSIAEDSRLLIRYLNGERSAAVLDAARKYGLEPKLGAAIDSYERPKQASKPRTTKKTRDHGEFVVKIESPAIDNAEPIAVVREAPILPEESDYQRVIDETERNMRGGRPFGK